MSETPMDGTATLGKQRPEGRVMSFVHGATAIIRRNPLMSLLSGVLLFLSGWFGELALDTVYRSFFPDPEAVRAQVLREQIATRTDSIAAQLSTMEENISRIGDGDENAQVFLDAAATVMRELQSLRPEIEQFAQEADRATARLASAKSRELLATGQSDAADFVLPVSGGVTLCPARFAMGVMRSGIFNGGADGGASFVDVSLDRLGESRKERLAVGRGTRLDSEGASVVVQYLGPLDDTGQHSFNFTCL